MAAPNPERVVGARRWWRYRLVLGLAGGTGWALARRGPAVPAPVVHCPAHQPDRPPPPRYPGAGRRLVPGTPTIATVCRYHGLNVPQPPGTLARSTVLRGDVRGLATDLNAGEHLVPGARYNCPNDTGEGILLVFGYPGGGTVSVLIDLTGCSFADNGVLRLFTSPAARQRLVALVGSDR